MTVRPTTKLSIDPELTSVRPSEPAAVVPLTILEENCSEEALREQLKVACIVIGCLAGQLYSPDSLWLAMNSAKLHCKGHEATLEKVARAVDAIRKSNVLSKMF